MKAHYIEYDWDSSYGYLIYVSDLNGEIIDEYTAGNMPGDSTFHSNQNYGLPLGRYARQTALEMAKEYGIPAKRVSHNSDLLAKEES